jgi:signal transduction histidine kinase
MLVLLGAAIVWSANRTRLERETEVRQETMTIARLTAIYLNQYFDGIDTLASVLLQNPAIVRFDQEESAKLLTVVVNKQPLLLNAALRDREGRSIASAGTTTSDKTTPVAPDDSRQTLQSARPAAGHLYPGPLTGITTLGQAYPIRAQDGTNAGVLAFTINQAHLQWMFERLALPEGYLATLIDQRGRVIARSDGPHYLGAATPHEVMLPGAEIRPELRADLDGVERFIGTVGLTRGPWSLSVGIPRTIVRQRLAPLWSRNLAISAGAVLAVVGLALWVSHHTSEGLNRLRSAAQRIAGGDLSPPAPARAPNLESAELQAAFVTMAQNLRTTRDALDRRVDEERKMRETVQTLQRQVVRQERLAAVGLLVSGVAHELNNPLQAILGTAELLERHPSLRTEMGEEISLLKTQSSRARDIIRNLSRFSSQQPAPQTLVDLSEVIAEVVQLRRHDLEKSGIAIDVDISASAKVYANVTELEQVTLNFVINAQQAIESVDRGRGRILLRLSQAARRVRLEVHDDGPGITPENEQKLFQPFFTTKPVGKGTGLGLSVSYGIIDSYGGAIGCYANEWQGATFFFELPVADLAAMERPIVTDTTRS